MSERSEFLVASGITKSYQTAAGPVEVLRGVDLEVAEGEMVAITGASGVGKSTLLHVIAGLLRPSEGEVLVDGEAVSRWTAGHRDRWRRR